MIPQILNEHDAEERETDAIEDIEALATVERVAAKIRLDLSVFELPPERRQVIEEIVLADIRVH